MTQSGSEASTVERRSDAEPARARSDTGPLGMALTSDFKSVNADVVAGFRAWRIWTRSAWYEVKRRYKRTVLGPFWNTMSLGVLALAMTYIWGPLLGVDMSTFLPHVLTGIVSWTFITTLINDGASIFTHNESLLKQLKFPLTALTLAAIWRNTILLFHNLIIVVAVMVVFKTPMTLSTLLFFPGLVLLAISGLWIVPLLGLLSARFRDIPPVVSNVLTVFYFVTPIFWHPEQLAERAFLYRYNVFHHLMDMIRSPMMGKAPAPESYAIVLILSVVGGGATYLLFAYFKRRIAYWL